MSEVCDQDGTCIENNKFWQTNRRLKTITNESSGKIFCYFCGRDITTIITLLNSVGKKAINVE